MPEQKNIIIGTILAVIIVVLGFIFLWPQSNQVGNNNNNNNTTNPPPQGLEITSPKPGDKLVSPAKIAGSISGNGWIAFEGQVGIVKLFDSSNKELSMGILTATQDWMQLPVPFETTLFFDYPSDEGDGTLVFYNENPSGEAQRNQTYTMPVKLGKSSGEKTKVKVYFSNNALNTAVSCSTVFYAEREIPKTEGVGRAALEELLKGPTDLEKTAGFSTNINSGVKVQSLAIKDGVATVDFNQALQEGVAGSCKVTAIRAQIEQTLKQFPTIKNVVISVNGEKEEILQP